MVKQERIRKLQKRTIKEIREVKTSFYFIKKFALMRKIREYRNLMRKWRKLWKN